MVGGLIELLQDHGLLDERTTDRGRWVWRDCARACVFASVPAACVCIYACTCTRVCIFVVFVRVCTYVSICVVFGPKYCVRACVLV